MWTFGVGRRSVWGRCQDFEIVFSGGRWIMDIRKRTSTDAYLILHAVNLALSLSNLSARPRVGLLDLDIFGPSIPKLMGLEGAGEPFLTSGECFGIGTCFTRSLNNH